MPPKGRSDKMQGCDKVGAGQVEPAPEKRTRSIREGLRAKATSIITVAATAAVVVVLGVAIAQVISPSNAISDFEFVTYQGQETLGGSRVNFGDLIGKGRPVVLNFWGSDCSPCLQEMPAFQRIYERHMDDMLFVGLDVGIFTGLGTRQGALSLLEQLGITYPAGTPPGRTPVDDYAVDSLPTTIFFTAKGKVFRRWDGGISEERMNAIVDALLEESYEVRIRTSSR